MANKMEGKPIPPYIGWAAWNRLMESMKTFIPQRLDRSYFDSLRFSGTQYSQAMRAFSFLHLIDETKKPTEKLRQLIMGTDEERKAILKSAIEEAYKPFFDNPGPQNATLGDLQTFLRDQGAKGSIDKCVTFFLAAAKDTGIPLSPQLAGEFGRKSGRKRKSQGKVKSKQPELFERLPFQQATGLFAIDGIDPKAVSYVAELPEEEQDKWIKAYIKMRKALREEQTQP